jgi:hypothetical protein
MELVDFEVRTCAGGSKGCWAQEEIRGERDGRVRVSREERYLVVRVRDVVAKEDDVVREEGGCTSNFEVGLVINDFGLARPQRSNHPIDEVQRPKSN